MVLHLVDLLAGLLAGPVGCPLDQAKVLVWILIHIGLGYGYRFVKGAMPRTLYGLVIGTLFTWSMYGMGRLA
jgi:hypothetical protein